MAMLHKIAEGKGKEDKKTGGCFTDQWQFTLPVANALLRLLRASLTTGTWVGISTGKGSGLKVNVKNKGTGFEGWLDTAEQIDELAAEIEDMVDPPELKKYYKKGPVSFPLESQVGIKQ